MPRPSVLNLVDDDALARSAEELLVALARRPREIPSRYGYDARGSELFERIARLEAYYPPRLERAILRRLAPDLDPFDELVELGSGSGRKTRLLLDALLAHAPVVYSQLDVSGEMLRESCERYAAYHPRLRVRGAIGEFVAGLRWAAGDRAGRRLVVMLGSTIGNLDHEARRELWTALSASLEVGDGFLVGVDLAKDPAIVEAAYRCGYEGPDAVRTQFALNRLTHLNRLFGADFDPAGYEADSIYDSPRRTVEGRLTSTRPQVVTLLGTQIAIDDGEILVRDRMRKFTIDELAAEAADSDLYMTRTWLDDDGWYVMALFSPR